MKKILFINHEISPFTSSDELSVMGKRVPQCAQEHGMEIRTFMPKWGNINERRGQLHEVQRLSGMNIIINDTDHPLIIKVASIPQTKIQVYFIDNEEYFIKQSSDTVEIEGPEANGSGERAIFYARGVIETMKKLRWSPDIIVCQGWMSAFAPIYIKKAYQDEPSVCNAKIVTTLYDCNSDTKFEDNLKQSIIFKNITNDSLEQYNDEFTMKDLMQMAIDNSDGIIAASATVDKTIIDMAKNANAKFLEYQGEDFGEAFDQFYNSL